MIFYFSVAEFYVYICIYLYYTLYVYITLYAFILQWTLSCVLGQSKITVMAPGLCRARGCVPYTWAALLAWLSAKRGCRMGPGCLDSLVTLAGWAGLEAGLSL